MSRAEEKGYEAYPIIMHTLIPVHEDMPNIEQDCNVFHRQAYIKGYHQAEKDLELTWRDMKLIWNITDEMDNMPEEEFYQEVLNRFNKMKEK